jgi:PAS domain S-box-containing protein
VKHIIIVDDRVENRYMLESLLKGEEFTVISSNNGEEALALARQSPPDLIISDILMPVMDGFTLCKEWRKDEKLRKLPFIFYTAAYTSPQDIKYALRLGADRFLIKPQEPEEFLTVIHHVLKDYELGEFVSKSETDRNEAEGLREYNAVLFRKLEDKLYQSEQAEMKLKRYSFELEQKNQKLRQSRNNLVQIHNLLDNFVDYENLPLVTWNSAFIIERFNHAFESLTGYQAKEAAGQKLDVLIPESKIKETLSMIKKTYTNERWKPVEISLLTKSGAVKKVYWNFMSITDDEGEAHITAIAFGDNIARYTESDEINRNVTERLELSIKERTAELEKSREELRGLSFHLQNIREEERKNIAREIHDELGHLLTSLKLDMEGVVNPSNKSIESVRNRLNPLIDMVDAAIDSVRTIATELRPAVLDNFGLIPTMEWQIKQFRIRTGTECEFKCNVGEIAFNNEESTAIFRIFQEILTNISRHAHATKVMISFNKKDTTLKLEVKDNGAGFEPNKIDKLGSFGLLGMSERALSIHGNLSFESIPGIGTTVALLMENRKE